jgi:pyruvate/2-oxoglutarate/acetoin dehydrogenase E1 component
MSALDRVGVALNEALHELFRGRPRLFLLGQDIADPYGGAFGITRGLSTGYPDRVLGTPISESATVGAAAGLALAGDEVIVEVMFGDFVTLCFDPIVNFLSKSVSMYGRRLPMRVLIRCPVGGRRGYGPTHSQSPQKHLLGVPHLALYELSPLHPVTPMLNGILDSGEPAVLFEDKVLYTQPRFGHQSTDALFQRTEPGGDCAWATVGTDGGTGDTEWAVIAPGGLVRRVLDAMTEAFLSDETGCRLFVPARLFPLDLAPVVPQLARAARILVVEDGPAGGGWAAEVALRLHELLWGRLRHPVTLLRPECAVIPAAPHLERRLLIQSADIGHVLAGAVRA